MRISQTYLCRSARDLRAFAVVFLVGYFLIISAMGIVTEPDQKVANEAQNRLIGIGRPDLEVTASRSSGGDRPGYLICPPVRNGAEAIFAGTRTMLGR